MKIIFVKRFHIPLFILGGLLGIGLIFSSESGAASGSVTPDQCCRCHTAVCEQTTGKRYVHAPVLENHCAVCHVKGDMPTVVQQGDGKEDVVEIDWFAKDCQEDHEHWFELPSSLASTTVSLMAKVNGRVVLEQDVDLPALQHAERFPLSQDGPKIFDLSVVEIKKGVFLSSRIAWKTDRITDAQVFYGEGNLGATSAVDTRWSKDHEITLTGLDAGRKYTFVAVSHDIYDNKAMSAKMTFSTDSFYSAPVRPNMGVQGQVGIQANFYQEKERLFAHFASSHPVSMRLGLQGDQPLGRAATGSEANLPQEHLELTDPHSLTITVCVGCHPQATGVHSHPVNIRPKAGMNIPPDYSTMADGRLSCMSCHQAHSSDNEYRLTKAKRKDLCLGCHRNFG